MAGPFQITHNAPEVAAALAKVPERAQREIGGAIARGAVEVANEMKRRAPKFRSTLTNSIIAIEKGPMEWHVSPRGVRYGWYVEGGTTGGGQPTLREMIQWVRLKGIQPRIPGMGQSELAALIRRRIAQGGIKASPFAQPALEAKQSRLNELVRAAAQRALAGGAAP